MFILNRGRPGGRPAEIQSASNHHHTGFVVDYPCALPPGDRIRGIDPQPDSADDREMRSGSYGATGVGGLKPISPRMLRSTNCEAVNEAACGFCGSSWSSSS